MKHSVPIEEELNRYPNPLTPYYERYKKTKQVFEKAKRSGTSDEKRIAKHNFTAAKFNLHFRAEGYYSEEVLSARTNGTAKELLRFKIDAEGNEAVVEIDLSWSSDTNGEMAEFLKNIGRQDLVTVKDVGSKIDIVTGEKKRRQKIYFPDRSAVIKLLNERIERGDLLPTCCNATQHVKLSKKR